MEFACNGLKIPCLVNFKRKVLGSSIRLSLAESTVSSWVGVVLHAEKAAVLLKWKPAVGPLLGILLRGGSICQNVDEDSHIESL